MDKTKLAIDEDVVKLYMSGSSMRQIADIYILSETTIRNILLKNKVKIRSKSDSHKRINDDIFIGLYNIGLSTSQISKLLDIHPTTVTKRLKMCNFPARMSKTAKSILYREEEFNKYFLNNNGFVCFLREKMRNGSM